MSTLRRLTVVACLLLLAALIFTPSLQIVMRGIFNVPMSGAEELTRYFLIALTLLGAAHVTHEGGQIRMQEFQAMLPARLRFAVQMLIEVAAVGMFTLMAVASVVSIGQNLTNQTATLEMPFWLFMAPLALGATLLALETAVMLAHTWQRKRPEEKQTTLS